MPNKKIEALNASIFLLGRLMERVMGVEPTSQPWEGRILPMKYTRIVKSKIWLRNSAEWHYFDSNYNYNK